MAEEGAHREWLIPKWKIAFHTDDRDISEKAIKDAYNFFCKSSKSDKAAMAHLHTLTCWINHLSLIQQDLHGWMENRALVLDDQYDARLKKLEQAWANTQGAINKILMMMPEKTQGEKK